MPYTYHSVLADAGLADTTGLLNVNPRTLQHVKYDNIFGLGDVTNVPTTKTFYGGVSQVHVLRNNIERKLNGLSLNAQYDGFAEAPLYLDQDKVAWVSHLYGGVEQSFETSGFSTGLRYKIHTKFGKADQANILKFKSWGPPYYKFKKTFEGGASGQVSSGALHPEQKTA
jgi:sulfide:quinone oxidoreductase